MVEEQEDRGVAAAPVGLGPDIDQGYLHFDPDIRQFNPDELQRVEELSVSRPGIGSITFHGATDCTNVDFEKLVRLEVGEVLVYPEPGSQPPAGQGLNKRATVTMFQCWPPNGAENLRDPKSQERYRR